LRDLSLHLLDILENSVAAGASVIAVTIEERIDEDALVVSVEDDGHGLRVTPDEAQNPFYTTKSGKRTGLGIALFKAAAERAGGSLTLGRSDLGGVAVRATMRLRHVDRNPLGDLSATLSATASVNTELDLRCRLRSGAVEFQVGTREISATLPDDRRRGLVAARLLAERVKAGLGMFLYVH
jgi:anti-sigma regulatory factor (Ser/Thr protein kinase)